MQRRGLIIIGCVLLCVSATWAQAGRRNDAPRNGAILVNVTAKRADAKDEPIALTQFGFFDAGVQQEIKTFTPDPGPANIILLVDTSATLRADEEKLQQAVREFAYEIYEGDKLMLVRYADDAEVASDWTDNAKEIEKAAKTFRKNGDPRLFDALHAVLADALDPLAATTKKRVVVVISDGLDRNSKTNFDAILAELQEADIAVYALQAPDRTGGAYRRDRPKPPIVLEKLATGTGGLVLPLDDAQASAKTICDELRNNRYLLSYQPSAVPFGEARSLLVSGNDGIIMRAKTTQPPK